MPRLREVVFIGLILGFGVLPGFSSLNAQPGNSEPAKFVLEPDASPLLTEPKTPEEFFSASLLMLDLGRLDLAQRYLTQFSAASPDDEILIKLRNAQGTGAFVKIARVKELQSLGSEILQKLNAASRKQSEDPAYIESLLRRLAGDPTDREIATIELRNAGTRAVPHILKLMRQKEMSEMSDRITVALIRMGRQVVPPLLGALDSPEDQIRSTAFEVFSALNATEVIPYLWYPAFAEDDSTGVRLIANRTLSKLLSNVGRQNQLSSVFASVELRRLSKLFYTDSSSILRDTDGNITFWSWDETEQTVVSHKLTPELAAMLLSARFGNQAVTLTPENNESQRQYLASLLALEVMYNGWDKRREVTPQSAMYLAVTAGEETISGVLADALAADQPWTSVPALQVLGQIGTREQLTSAKGLKSPVIAALNSPDPRVQFAAALTILRLEPKSSFPGATRIVPILTRALNESGKTRAVVIDPDHGRANSIAGVVNDMGYESLISLTGRDGFELAATNAGVAVILVHVNCMRWELTQTLTNLRADSRTAAIPIAVYGSEDFRGSVARLVSRSKPSTFIAESGSPSDFRRQLSPFVGSSKLPPLSASERQQQRADATYWLATVATSRGMSFFDVSQAEPELQALADLPEVGVNAMIALSSISTASAQKRLSQIAANSQSEPVLRQTAATQLNYHIQRYGLLLSKEEVEEIRTAWSSADDQSIKSALATVIGSLKPNSTLVGERLRQFPSPVVKTP